MSGIKDMYVTMRQSQRDALLRNAAAAAETAVQAQYRERQAKEALNNANAKVSELTKALNSEINGLNSEIKKLTKRQNERLTQQANNFKASINELKSQMAEDKAELEQAISDIQSSLEKKEQSHKNIAEFWIGQTHAFFEDIQKYRHELFAPNRLNQLKLQLDQVMQDIKAEAYQSAIGSARSIFNNAAALREMVVNSEIEWSHFYNELLHELAAVKSEINYSRTMKFVFETEEGAEEIDAQIDYWTNNGLSEIENKVKIIDNQLENANELSTEKLIEMIDELKHIEADIHNVQERAKVGVLASQNRAEMAGVLADALAGKGWECTGYTYEESELVKPLHIKFEDGNGNEIVAVISPECINDTLANNLAVNFFDPYNNDEATRGIWIDSIRQTLSDTGLEVGTPKCRSGYEVKSSDKHELKNIEKTRQKKIQREN